MRRIWLWFLSTVSAVVLLFGYHTSTSGATGPTATPAPVTAAPSAGAGPESGGTEGGGGTGSSTTTGPAVQTRYGPVQVEITTAGARLEAVSVVDYPRSSGRDAQISSYALPILVQASLDAQSADVDMVSGATYTSEGYVGSLQAALDEAGL